MGLVAWLTRVIYCVFCLLPQRRRIAFLSRQAERPFDFTLLEPELRRRFPGHEVTWCCVHEIGRMSIPLMLRQLRLVATSELCLVDGYVPAVSLPRSHRGRVVQVWHAPGAIKRFGYQALDTPAGRSSRAARTLCMHRGYDLVVAGMPGAVRALSEAFDVPTDKIAPLGLPRIDYLRSSELSELRERRYARAEDAVARAFAGLGDADPRTTVLYAPTFRKGCSDALWLEHAVSALRSALAATDAPVRLMVASHPLETAEEHDERGGVPVAFLHGTPTIDLLHLADFVVTDYSTVAFEAGYAGRRVLFYVPDIEEYRVSPGLNIDPLLELPTISSTDAAELAAVVAGEKAYDDEAFQGFMDSNTQGVLEGSTHRIGDRLEAMLGRRSSEELSR